jgi:hypothetical protein
MSTYETLTLMLTFGLLLLTLINYIDKNNKSKK